MNYKIKVTQPHTKFNAQSRVVYIRASHYEPKYTDNEVYAYPFNSKQSALNYIRENKRYLYGEAELVPVSTELDKFIEYLESNIENAHEDSKVTLFDITRLYSKYKGELK